jgi:phage shock protein C
MKRIYRDESHAKIAGICAGIADAFDIDPAIVRLATVFLCVATLFWPVALTYLAGWFIIPHKPSAQPDA